MGWHIDDVSIFEHIKSFRENRYELFSKNDTPIYTMILYFSSCIGGEFEFVDKVVKPERGFGIFFDGREVRSGIRESMVIKYYRNKEEN